MRTGRDRPADPRAGGDPPLLSVVIVGGGFSSAAVAFHLAQGRAPVAITVIEPRAMLGAGLAYSTADPSHRINVPAAMMSLDPADTGHFARWLDATDALADDPEARLADGRAFPRRSLFGRYVAAHLVPHLASGRIDHIRDRAQHACWSGGRHELTLASGRRVEADLLVLAASHPPPQPLPVFVGLADSRIIGDPWAEAALAGIGRDDRVLIVGTGLTMADTVASLDRWGHRGPITALSRRGLRSRGHAGPSDRRADTAAPAPTASLSALVAQVRHAVAQAAGRGAPWQDVLDAVRVQAPVLWAALPDGGRRSFLRHLRPFWDTHRFRIAPQVEAVLARREAAGSFTILAASIRGARPKADTIDVDLHLRRTGEVSTRGFDAVVVTTGPAHDRIFDHDPFLAALRAAGLVTADPLGLGLSVDGASRAVGPAGRVGDTVLVAGPLARGRFGELIGVPEVSRQAVEIARSVAEWAWRRSDHTLKHMGISSDRAGS
jgi:uncharacterized NAD(P)/FAD-binding protein YdhS